MGNNFKKEKEKKVSVLSPVQQSTPTSNVVYSSAGATAGTSSSASNEHGSANYNEFKISSSTSNGDNKNSSQRSTGSAKVILTDAAQQMLHKQKTSPQDIIKDTPPKSEISSVKKVQFNIKKDDSGSSNGANAPQPSILAGSKRKMKDFYLIGKKLGEGSYGKVRFAKPKFHLVGRENEIVTDVAVKSILKKKVRRTETLIREIGIMKEMEHPHIVKLYDVFEDSTHLHIVMELCLGGELFDHITAQKSFSEFEAAGLMRQILDAVKYLHERNIAHRDLKPENFLFKERDKPTNLKIIDFGLSRFYIKESHMQTRVGTPYYIAPEVLSKNYDLACDVWSVGVIMYILLCGYPPFWGDTEKEIFQRIKAGEFDFPSEEWDVISPEAKDLIKKMLTVNPLKRIKAADALNHLWFAKEQNKQLLPVMMSKLSQFAKQNKIKRIALGMIARWLNEVEIKTLKQQFEVIDEDNNGTISLSELSQAMQRAGLQPSKQDVSDLLKVMDADGNGKIDYREFIAATMEEHLYMKDDLLHRVFETFDTERRGKLSIDTLAASIGEHDPQVIRKMIAHVCPGAEDKGEIDFEIFKKLIKVDDQNFNVK